MNSEYYLLLILNLLNSEVFFVLEKQKFGNVYRKRKKRNFFLRHCFPIFHQLFLYKNMFFNIFQFQYF